jgi:phosphoglycerate dehydrogenase-like enzyme
MEKKIILLSLYSFRLMPEFKQQLESAGNDREILVSIEPAEVEPFLERIEIGMGDIPFTLIPRMPCFRWWQLWSAGADVLQHFPALKELPFQMSTTSGIQGQQIAEHLFSMLLSWNRCIPQAIAAQKRREWFFIQDKQLSVLNGKTMLIIGYGAIGKTIARIAVSFGLKVIGLRRNPAVCEDVNGVLTAPVAELRNFLPLSDYIVNILPFTQETRHFFDTDQFKLMKNSALYINMGRGATTNETALINALREKRITGALLDVAELEPLPANSPLWDMDNVIITGHYAGCHPEYSRLAMSVALENLERYKHGESLKNLVDKNRGY